MTVVTAPSTTPQAITTEVVIFATYARDKDGYPTDQPQGSSRKDVAALVEAGWSTVGERMERRDGVPAVVVTLSRVAE